MASDFEAIWEALHERLATGTTGFTTITRNAREQWGIEQYPVLEILEKDETPALDEDGLPPLYTLTGVIGVSVRVVGEESPWTKLNTLIRAVRVALERQPGDTDPGPYQGNRHWTNLGGLVHTLTVGRVEKIAGDQSGEAWARIEFEMTAL